MYTAIIPFIIIVTLLLLHHLNKTHTKICNDIDNRCYDVVNEHSEKDEASANLGRLNKFSIQLLRNLREKYVFENYGNFEQRSAIRYLLSNYNPDNLIENRPYSSDSTSYVDDKGRVFAVCLREKITGQHKFHDMHLLQFVHMHELSHLATYSYAHGLIFWRTFKFILTEAVSMGLYQPIDYSVSPINYCSLVIDYNPYFDSRIQSI